MKLSIRATRTLIYYDGPVAFIGEDKIGTSYVCVLTERLDMEDEFLAVPISKGRLHKLVIGTLDLRIPFETPENKAYFKINTNNYKGDSIEMTLLEDEHVNADWFPLPETFINVSEIKELSEEVTKQAVVKNSAIIEFGLNPPESSSTETIIATPTLANALILFQNLLKYAYKKSIKTLDRKLKKALDSSENYQTDVIGIATGSFKVILKSKTPADLTGYVDIERALSRLHDILKYSQDTEKTVLVLQENSGHLVSTYLKLLEFIIKNNTPIFYNWTLPNQLKVNRTSVTRVQATNLYQRLSALSELKIENLIVTGEFEKIDVGNNSWTVKDEDGKKISGGISEKSKKPIRGKTVGVTKYRFEIEERIEESEATGKEYFTYTMIDFELLNP